MESGRIFYDRWCDGNMVFLGSGDSFCRGGSMISMEETSKRRPYFSTAAEEEYYEEQLPEKKRRLTSDQVYSLEKSFEMDNKLEPERKTQLAKKLGLQPRQVAIWFQNRRARWKTKQLDKDYHHLKSSYDSLLANFDSISKENHKLKAQLVSLREKLQGEEPPAGEPAPPRQISNSLPAHAPVKMEDGLSAGSDVVDDDHGTQLLDSDDSYFPNNINTIDSIQSSEEEDGGSSFPYVFPVAEHNHQDEEPLGWFIWP